MKRTSETYECLYHYTTEAGLIGIVESQSLWATNVKYLNDSSELVHFREIAPKLLPDQVFDVYDELYESSAKAKRFFEHNGGTKQVAEHDSIKIIDAMYKATGDNFFIASFCGKHEDEYVNNNGLMSQWRGYGGSQGVMIEFVTKGLEDLLDTENLSFAYDNLHLSDVVYADDQTMLQGDLSTSIRAIAEYAESLLRHQLLKAPEPGAGEAMSGFPQCITRYKHRGFKEEREVRIAAWVPHNANQEEIEKLGGVRRVLKPVKQRNRNKKPVPYIELFGEAESSLPIKKIVVGPHQNKEELATRLREKLKSNHIEVAVSDIPYVNLYSAS